MLTKGARPAATIAELIVALQSLPQDAVPIATGEPIAGVAVIGGDHTTIVLLKPWAEAWAERDLTKVVE